MFKIISNITTINNTKFADVIFINDVVEHVFLNVLLDNNQTYLLENFGNTQQNKDIYDYILSLFKNNTIEESLKRNLELINNSLDNIENIKTSQYNENDIFGIFAIVSLLDSKYDIKNNKLYYGDTLVPKILLNYFHTAILTKDDVYLNSLHKFWLNVLAKRDYSNIQDLFLFIHDNGLTITPEGYLFTFRRIVNKYEYNANVRLLKFTSKVWIDNIAANKNNDNCYVYYDSIDDAYLSTFDTVKNQSLLFVGNVTDIMNHVTTEISYTDNHTKKFNYKINHTYVVDNVDNNPNNYCSYGLHLGSKRYVTKNTWLGETIVGCFVNPRDIIAVADSYSKLRVRKMHIACIIEDIDTFDYKLLNYEFKESMMENDNVEFANYVFNEAYQESAEIIEQINNLEAQKKECLSKLQQYQAKTNVDLSQIINNLNNNYVSTTT